MNNIIFNYSLNKFCPYIIIFFLLFYESNFDVFRSALIIGACIFIDKFSFKTGYAVSFCEQNNIKLK